MATWYAQKGSCNINSVSGGTTSDVWNSAAGGGGSWMDISVLTAGGGDVLAANNQSSILINIDINLGTGRISTAAEGGTAGGSFLVAAARTITANVLGGTTICLALTGSTGTYALTINGNVTGGGSAGAYGLNADTTSGTVTININGVVTGGTNATAYGVNLPSSKGNPLNIQAGSGANAVVAATAPGIKCSWNPQITVGSAGTPCNVIAATGVYGVDLGFGKLTVYGNVSGNGTGTGVYGSTFTVIVTGNVTGGTTGKGIQTDSTGTITVTGTVTGGTSTAGYGLYMNSTGTMTVNGDVVAGTGDRAYGVYNLGSGTFTVNNGNIVNSAYTSAIMGKCLYNPGATNYVQYPKTSGTVKLGPEPAAGELIEGAQVGTVAGTYHEAAESEVEYGVTFGASEGLTGEYTGPSAEDVADAVWGYAARTLT